MKKLSLVLLSTFMSTQAVQAAPGAFNGFYLGGQLGWIHRSDKTNFPVVKWNATAQDSPVNKTETANGMTYGLYSGYGQNCYGFYWGAEFSIENDTVNSGSNHNVEVKIDGVKSDDYPTKLHTKYERGVVFGLTPRIGAVLGDDNLIYVKFGMELSRDKLEATHEWKEKADPQNGAKTTKSASKTQFVFVPGIGYERAFGKVLVRAEYGYNFGAKLTTPNLINPNNLEGNHKTPATVKYSAHLFKVGLAYKF